MSKNLAIALCRVSSLEQLENNSLSHQRDNVLKAADELGVIIPEDGIWSGHVSSKKGVNYNRKDLREMLEYCKKHPRVKYLIVQEVDRFMRSPDEQVYFQVMFSNEVDVKIWYADKPELNQDSIYAGLMRYMEWFRAAGSNDERQRKSINGQAKALEEGRYTFSPKPGYKRGYERGIQLVHEVRGPALKQVLVRIADKLVTPTQGLIELNKSDFMIGGHSPYKMDKFRKIVTDPFYAGIVEIDKQVKVRNENGLHEALITREQHYELLRIMAEKKKTQKGPRKNGNPKYPLSNHVTCGTCNFKSNRYVGFDHGNGSNKALVYEKYRCRGCGRYLSRDELHRKVKRHIKQNRVTRRGNEELVRALKIVWEQKDKDSVQEINRINHKIASIRNLIGNQVEAAIDPSNLGIKDDILASIAKRKVEITSLEEEVESLKGSLKIDKKNFLQFALGFVGNLSDNFFELSPENRIKCKQLLYPSGFYLDSNNNVYTPEISLLITLQTKKKDAEASDNSHLVRVRGL